MSPEDKQRLYDHLEGTSLLIDAALESLGLDHFTGEEGEDAMLDLNLEYCHECGVWMESAMLEPDDEENGNPFCQNCRPKLFGEDDE